MDGPSWQGRQSALKLQASYASARRGLAVCIPAKSNRDTVTVLFASDDQEQPCKMNIILAQMRIPFRQHTLFPFYVNHYVVVSSQEREARMGEKRGGETEG